ncbi:MAG: hypothetical protein JNK78_09200 [Planctomycetes bacterium]|nr:hypothetical protein [Planctomycetota bacterium]
MSAPDRSRAEAMVQRVLAGDASSDDPDVRRVLAPFPDLAEELRDLLEVRAAMDAGRDDIDTIESQARAEATDDDARFVRRVVAPEPQRRPWTRWSVAAAALVAAVLWFAWNTRDGSRDHGRLRGEAAPRIDRSVSPWSIDPGVPLPPGSRYVATLEIDGRSVGAPESFVCPIVLPASWQRAVDHAHTATLVVEIPDLGSLRRVALR